MVEEKKKSPHVGHFIILLNQTSNSCEHAPRHTDASPINWAPCRSIWMIKKTAHLVNTAVPVACYIKASLYDKALADQIRRDLQLVPSWLSRVDNSSLRKS